MVGLIVEESCLNLRSLVIDQLDVQEGSLRSGVLPGFLGMLFSHTGLNLPVEKEGVESLDRGVNAFSTLIELARLAIAIDSLHDISSGDDFSRRFFLLLLL